MGSTPTVVVEYSQRKDMVRKKLGPRRSMVRVSARTKRKHYVRPSDNRSAQYCLRPIQLINRLDLVAPDLWEDVMHYEWADVMVPSTPGTDADVGEIVVRHKDRFVSEIWPDMRQEMQ